jgi:hypothetical protein
MARRGSAALSLGVALMALATPAVTSAQSKTLSKTEARALPPAELTHRVMDQVADLLTPSDPRPTSGRKPVKPLRDLAFQSTPRATWAPGVCARDGVVVTFEPAKDGQDADQGADTAMRAASLKASTRYRMVAPPAREDDYYDGPPPPEAQEACAGLAGQETGFFSAPTAEAALSGAWWLTRAAEGAAGPNPAFQIDCRVATATPESCPAILRRLAVADLRSAWPCPDDRRAAQTLRCWTLKVLPADKTYDLRVFVGHGPGAAIARIEVDEQVLTGESLAD